MKSGKITMIVFALIAYSVLYAESNSAVFADDMNQCLTKETTYTLTIENTENGSINVTPDSEDNQYEEGTEIEISATPDENYSLDSIYYISEGTGILGSDEYKEFLTEEEAIIKVAKDLTIGVSFINSDEIANLDIKNNIVYAKPGLKQLKYDVYAPKGAHNLPGIIIIHGGGWCSNNEDIMRGMARQIANTGKYVVCSIDYRWANTGMLPIATEEDAENNSVVDLMNDCFGAIIHIQEHAQEYGINPIKIAVTGDSAGGHLSAAVATMCDRIGDKGFGETDGIFEFLPSYLPEDQSIESAKEMMVASIKAVAPSYGVYANINTYSMNPNADETWSEALSPINNIPDGNERKIPHFILRGSEDTLITDENVMNYVTALAEKGQRVRYIEVEGATHAFLDWKPDKATKAIFEMYAVPNINKMIKFFDSVFYRKRR